MLKSNGTAVMLITTSVEREIGPQAPMIRSLNVPREAAGPAVTLKVEDPPAHGTEGGLMLTPTPVGEGPIQVQLKLTVPVQGTTGITVIVEKPEVPGWIVMELGLADSVKSQSGTLTGTSICIGGPGTPRCDSVILSV